MATFWLRSKATPTTFIKSATALLDIYSHVERITLWLVTVESESN